MPENQKIKILKGLKNISVFPVLTNTETEYEAGPAIPVPGAQTLGIVPDVNEWQVFADDRVYESGRDWNGMTVNITVAELALILKQHFEGGTWDETEKVYKFKETDIPPEIGMSFAAQTSDGQYRMVKIPVLRTNTVSGEYQTKGQGGDGSSPVNISATATSRRMDGVVKLEKDSEGGDLTWLNTLNEVPEG